MLALDDSEIPINHKFAALSLLLSDKDEILPDPCKSEEMGAVVILFLLSRIATWSGYLCLQRAGRDFDGPNIWSNGRPNHSEHDVYGKGAGEASLLSY